MVGGHLANAEELDAVVRIGECSGVVVAPRVVLTSAHCVNASVMNVVTPRSVYLSANCETHAAPPSPQDVALCRLVGPAEVTPIDVDDGPLPDPGTALLLAGYGTTGPLARDGGTLRVVDTTLGAVVGRYALHDARSFARTVRAPRSVP